MDDASWIEGRLPPSRPMERRCEADFYGASCLISDCLGRSTVPRSFATWSHAWQLEPTTHPRQVLSVLDIERRHLVATRAHRALLLEAGYGDVHAVGLPFVYADHVRARRRAGSLLVMPAHTLHWADYDWDEQTYVDLIAELKPHFSCIVACVQANCVESGYWTEAFQRRGIPWIAGASSHDGNALLRVMSIMRSFEYVTTNRLASHVPYAAYAGCKVSVFGPYLQPLAQHYTNHPFYRDYPEVLQRNIRRSSERAVRLRYPSLFADPRRASDHSDWARKTLGADCRVDAPTLARLLGWGTAAQLVGHTRRWGKNSARRASRIAVSVQKRLPGQGRRRAA